MFRNSSNGSMPRKRPVMVWTDAEPESAASLVRDNLLDLNAFGVVDRSDMPVDETDAIVVEIQAEPTPQTFDANPVMAMGMPEKVAGVRFADSSIASASAGAEILVGVSASPFIGTSDTVNWPAHAGSDSAGMISRNEKMRSLPAA